MHPSSGAPLGYADFVAGEQVTGWAIDPRAPTRPLCLRVVLDGADAGELGCGLPRADVRAAGIDSDVGGFRYAIPAALRDGHDHALRLLLPGGGAVCFPARDGSLRTEHRFRLDCAGSVEGGVDRPGAEAIEGWALRRSASRDTPLGACEVAVLLHGAEIARLAADLHRADVAAAQGCDPRVGFHFTPPAHLRTGRDHSFAFIVLPERVELPGSPVTASFLPGCATSRLAALADQTEALLTQAWMLRRSVRELLPAPGYGLHDYDAWARRYRVALRARVERARRDDVAPAPLVSLVCPLRRPPLTELMALVESVRRQTHARWELILVDDASRAPPLSACLRALAAADARIRVLRSRRAHGDAAAANLAIAAARGEWVGFLEPDATLDEAALEAMLRAARAGEARVLYSDEDAIAADGRHCEPNLKPGWNARLALACNFPSHLLMIETALLRAAGALDPALEGAYAHDLLLHLSERVTPEAIRHVPEILYHRRQPARRRAPRPAAVEAGRRAVAAHLERRGLAAAVTPIDGDACYRLRWRFAQEPSVRVIVPFRDQAPITRSCVETLLSSTEYANYRVTLIDNGSATAEAAALCADLARHPRVTVLRDDGPFNYARLNNRAAREADAEFLLLLNNDVLVEQADWLRRMVDEALADPRVAAVGCKLVYPDRRVQHAGVVLGAGGVGAHAFKGESEHAPGYQGRARCAQEYAAVTAACLLCRAEAFRAVGGLDQETLGVAFNDVDLCLKLRAAGWRVVWTPDVVAEHHESLSRGDDMTEANRTRFAVEDRVMVERWGAQLAADPFYSPHFTLHGGTFRTLADESLVPPPRH